MTKTDSSKRATKAVTELSAEQAYTVGAAVGSLLQQGMPVDDATPATVSVAAFIKKGMAAQQVVDEIIAAYAAGTSIDT